MELYVRGLNKRGKYFLISLEDHTYGLEARFTKDPSDTFSVAEEKILTVVSDTMVPGERFH
jgi:hypothetical protein